MNGTTGVDMGLLWQLKIIVKLVFHPKEMKQGISVKHKNVYRATIVDMPIMKAMTHNKRVFHPR